MGLLVVLVDALFGAVFLDGLRLVFEMAEAVRLLDQRVGAAVEKFVGAAHGQERHRVIPARRGTVLVDAAALGFHELAGAAALDRFQLHARHAVFVHLERHRILLEEFARGQVQALLQAQDVIRGEGDVDVGTAGVPALDVAVAAELQRRVLGQHGGLHRAVRKRRLGDQVVEFGFVHLATFRRRGPHF